MFWFFAGLVIGLAGGAFGYRWISKLITAATPVPAPPPAQAPSSVPPPPPKAA